MPFPVSRRSASFRLGALLGVAALAGCLAGPVGAAPPARHYEVTRSDAEWKAKLTPAQYRILREQGTERAFTGEYWSEHRAGTYACRACDLPLFTSTDKFESGTGWPSYTRPVQAQAVDVATDGSLGMARDEVSCHRCGGHLGHVFDDGPPPTGKRFCINSASLTFTPK